MASEIKKMDKELRIIVEVNLCNVQRRGVIREIEGESGEWSAFLVLEVAMRAARREKTSVVPLQPTQNAAILIFQ